MKPDDIRSYIVLTKAERNKFKDLGGGKWLKKILAETPETQTRSAFSVGPEERAEIAAAKGNAKVVARTFKVSVDFVNYMRRKNPGVHLTKKKRKEVQC